MCNSHILIMGSLTSSIYIVKRLPIMLNSLQEDSVPKREKSKRLQVVITEEQDSLLTKTAYQLSNPERLVSKSEVVRLGIEMLNRAVEQGDLPADLVELLENAPKAE
jgi:hypothetical protein